MVLSDTNHWSYLFHKEKPEGSGMYYCSAES